MMQNNFKNSLNFLIILVLSFGLIFAQSESNQIKSQTIPPDLLQDVKQDPEASKLILNAELEAKKLIEQASQKAEEIKKKAAQDYAKLKQEIQEEVSQLTTKSETVGISIGNKAEEEALKLKKEAELEALKIINQAEEQAVKLREEAKRQKLEQEKKEALQKVEPIVLFEPQKKEEEVTDQWKKEVTNLFDKDVEEIKNIILEGEQDKDEQNNFLELFKDQKTWFDNTVSNTKTFFDPSYNAVMQKKSSIDMLVKAQRVADKFLQDLVEREDFSKAAYERMKVIVLYELNSLIQDAIKQGVASKYSTGIPVAQIENVAKDAMVDVRKKMVILKQTQARKKAELQAEEMVKQIEEEIHPVKMPGVEQEN